MKMAELSRARRGVAAVCREAGVMPLTSPRSQCPAGCEFLLPVSFVATQHRGSRAPVPAPVSVGSAGSALVRSEKQQLPAHKPCNGSFPAEAFVSFLWPRWPVPSSPNRDVRLQPTPCLLWGSLTPRRRCLFPTHSWFYGHTR